MTGKGADTGWSAGERLLAAAVLAALALRLPAIAHDPPGGVLTRSATFYTDEGCYLKTAKLLHAFGEWRNDEDINWYMAAPGYTALTVGLSWVFGLGLLPVRYASVAASALAVGVFYRLCRGRLSRGESLTCCLLVALTFDDWAFSRVAFAEPSGALFSLGALWAWVAWRNRRLALWGSLLCALLACVTKLTFTYTLLTVAVLWLGEAWKDMRSGERRRVWEIAVALVATMGLFAVSRVAIAHWAPDDARWFAESRERMLAWSTPRNVVGFEVQLLWHLGSSAWRRILVLALLIGAAGWLHGGRARRGVQERAGSRGSAAMCLWLAFGLGFFGLFWYQVPRWLCFSVFPFAWLAVVSVAGAVPERLRGRALGLLVVLHVASQIPALHAYATRPYRTSLLDTARDVAARVEDPEREVVLMGNFSHLVSLYAERVRPVYSTTYTADQIRRRISRWRPEYFVGLRAELSNTQQYCGDLVSAMEPVATYRVMDNYSGGGDVMLLRIRYHPTRLKEEPPS